MARRISSTRRRRSGISPTISFGFTYRMWPRSQTSRGRSSLGRSRTMRGAPPGGPYCSSSPGADGSSATSLDRLAAQRLALDPDLAALPYLLLPDRDGLLEPVDKVVAGLERRLAVRRGDGDEKRRLADLQAARAVLHSDAGDRPAGHRLLGDLSHHPRRHLRVGVVLQVEEAAAPAVVPDDAQKHGYGAALVLAHVLDEPLRVQWTGGDLKQPLDRLRAGTSAPAHGWYQRQLVARAQRVVRRDVFGVHGVHQAAGVVRHLREALTEQAERLGRAQPLAQLHLRLPRARKVGQTGEQAHLRLHIELSLVHPARGRQETAGHRRGGGDRVP